MSHIIPKIASIDFFDIHIPFKQTFSHASKRRSCTETVLVQVRDANGQVGHGEGCPRAYVTGETIQTAETFLQKMVEKFNNEFVTVTSLLQFSKNNKLLIDRNPSAWSAFECACLDLIAKVRKCSIESLFNLHNAGLKDLRYSAVLGTDLHSFEPRLQRYLQLEFRQYKLKLSGHSRHDQDCIQRLTDSGIHAENIRFDANNLWRNADEVIHYFRSINFTPSYLEEPVNAGNYAEMKKIHAVLGCRIILDESFMGIEDFQNITESPDIWVINLRVSRLGGVLRTLEIAQRAVEYNIPLLVGSHVGETSLLTRVATLIATAYRQHIIAMEGAFSDHLLEYDLFEPKMRFSRGGNLEPIHSGTDDRDYKNTAALGHGWGLQPATRIRSDAEHRHDAV